MLICMIASSLLSRMPPKMSTTLRKLESVQGDNGHLLQEFYQYMRSKGSRSERHTNNLLTLLIAADKFWRTSFKQIDKKEQITSFLDHQYVDGKWVVRQHDVEGKYISSWNHYLRLLTIFFRWLTNVHRDKLIQDETWETPTFLKIKSKKALRESPYDASQIWERDEVLKIVEYEPEPRNKAIITLLWDMDARNHEITALRVGDIVFKEQYAEGTIPYNTKTGGGSILLTCSFPYVRDWLNQHPFKNEAKASLICSLNKPPGAPVRSSVIWAVLERLRLRIKRIVENDETSKDVQKLEHLLRTKKWNPYCFRHSAITADSDYLPEYAVKKKVRWVMDSKQGARYVKTKMGDELRNKILEHSGIKLTNETSQSAIRTCGRCNYISKFESKYCDKCNYPLTQMVLDELKKQEESKMNIIVDQKLGEKDKAIQTLNERLAKMEESQLKFMELLNNPNMVQHIRANPQHFITAVDVANEDTAKYISAHKQVRTAEQR